MDAVEIQVTDLSRVLDTTEDPDVIWEIHLSIWKNGGPEIRPWEWE